MEKKRNDIVLASLNLVVSPHPPGTYQSVLRAMQNLEVPVFGDERAMLISLRSREISKGREIVQGWIIFYTEIKLTGEWFDILTKQPVPSEEIEEIKIPDNLRPNLRSSRFVFDVKSHRLLFEKRNEKGDRFAVTKVKKVFENLLATARVVAQYPDTSVTLVPRHDAIEKVLAVPNLKRVFIRLEKPNADDVKSQTRRLMKKLEAMRASKIDTIIVKERAATKLVLDDETTTMAEVAAGTGYVVAEGHDNEGAQIKRRTSDYPAEYILPLDDGQDPFSRVFAFLRHDIDD